MMWLVGGAAALAFAAGIVLLLSRRSSAQRAAAQQRNLRRGSAANDSAVTGRASARKSVWAAVSVKPGPQACDGAKDASNVRYLESAAPLLPLSDCDCSNCQCTFEHHADRRRYGGTDRRLGVGLKSELYGTTGEPERRERRGRRVTDQY